MTYEKSRKDNEGGIVNLPQRGFPQGRNYT